MCLCHTQGITRYNNYFMLWSFPVCSKINFSIVEHKTVLNERYSPVWVFYWRNSGARLCLLSLCAFRFWPIASPALLTVDCFCNGDHIIPRHRLWVRHSGEEGIMLSTSVGWCHRGERPVPHIPKTFGCSVQILKFASWMETTQFGSTYQHEFDSLIVNPSFYWLTQK